MSKLKAFWIWLKPRWYLPAMILLFALGWLWSRRNRECGTPMAQIKLELAAIDAAGAAKAKELELGALKARVWVEANYQAEKNALNAAQAKQAEELRGDPAKLAAFLVRAGSGK